MKSTLIIILLSITANSFAQEKINWITFKEAYEANKVNPKKIIVDVYTDWCGWCKKMEASTFQDSSIIKEINTNYYAVKMDGEQKTDIIIEDRTYKFVASGRRGYHELPAELMNGKMSYPTIVFLNNENQVIQPLPGYKSVGDLLPILEYLGHDHYLTTSWEKYIEQREGTN